MKFATRATRLIAEACTLAAEPTVLLPALFCVEVADAIEAAGISYRCYDLTADLAPCLPFAKTGAVLTLHPFGLLRRFRERPVPDDVLWIEDACHALRGYRTGDVFGDVVIYSPRKEFEWDDGGIATGPLMDRLSSDERSRELEQQWLATDLDDETSRGVLVTRRAREALGDRLPHLDDGDILYVLPLLTAQRDAFTERLRAGGCEAWYWRGVLAGAGPETTPGAWAIRERLCLVPLPRSPGPELERILAMLCNEPLEQWPISN
jgi:hypothetical protein